MGEHAEHGPPGELSAQAAVRTLSELGRYEEGLTFRAAGLTWMVYGMAVPGIFLSYNLAALQLTDGRQWAWLGPVLWIPWILGANLVAGGLWSTHALSLRMKTEAGKNWLIALGYTALFFLIMGGVYLLRLDFTYNATMTVVTGLFTMTLGTLHVRYGGRAAWPGFLAGVVVTAVGLVAGVSGLSPNAALVAGAGSVMVSYFAAGGVLYLRG